MNFFLFQHERNAYDCIDEIFSNGVIRLDRDNDMHSLGIDLIKSLINPVDEDLKKKVVGHKHFKSEYMFIYDVSFWFFF